MDRRDRQVGMICVVPEGTEAGGLPRLSADGFLNHVRRRDALSSFSQGTRHDGRNQCRANGAQELIPVAYPARWQTARMRHHRARGMLP